MLRKQQSTAFLQTILLHSFLNANINKCLIICHQMNFCHYLFGVIQCLKEKDWLKSNILYVKDLFDGNGVFREPSYFRNILIRKSNWICEYYTIKSTFKKLECSFDTSKGQYVNIKKIPMIYYTKNKQLKVIRLLKSKDFFICLYRNSLFSLILKICWRKCLT